MRIPPLFITIAIASVIAGIISYFANFNFWIVLLITLVGMFVNGIVAEVEDNMPGGFNNPTDDQKK
ncbi:hypothetical protein [Thalassotalea maritima]|uniref:hypothetical protein n=1 Tax=Thalassotalea maritima TaxID=3242416 RepID=UPI003529BBE3